MDINKLKVFLSVVDAGSINKAADKLGYSQAGISYIIKQIEEEFGITLLERSFNGVRLTVQGKAVISELKRAVNAYKSFEGVIDAQKSNISNTIHVAAVDTVTSRWFSEAVELLLQTNPDVNIDIIDGDPFEINEWVENGVVDIGITELDWAIKGNTWIHLLDDPYRAIFPPETGAPSPCPLSYFEGRRFYVPDFGRERTVPAMLKQQKVNVQTLYDKVGNLTILRSISKGRACTLMSLLEVEMCPVRTMGKTSMPEILQVEGSPHRDIGIVLKPENNDNENIKTFINCFKKAIADDTEWNNLIQHDFNL